MIKHKRKICKLSQKQLGELIGTTQACISALELHKREPSLTMLRKISKELDICMIDLCKEYLCSECKKECSNK